MDEGGHLFRFVLDDTTGIDYWTTHPRLSINQSMAITKKKKKEKKPPNSNSMHYHAVINNDYTT